MVAVILLFVMGMITGLRALLWMTCITDITDHSLASHDELQRVAYYDDDDDDDEPLPI